MGSVAEEGEGSRMMGRVKQGFVNAKFPFVDRLTMGEEFSYLPARVSMMREKGDG